MPVQVRLWAPNDNKRKGLNIEKPPENERLFLSIIITTCLEQFYFKTLPPALNGEGNTEPVPPAFAHAYGAHSA